DLFRGKPNFAWWVRSRNSGKRNMTREELDRRSDLESERLARFFELRDVILMESIHPGPSRVVVWASGRITEEGGMENPNPMPGAPAFVDAPSKEVLGVFDFIK